MQALSTKTRGFSLIELTVALLIITTLATIAVRSTNDLSFQVRHDQTKDRLAQIKQAIIGNPQRTVNGQPDISGFVADMGRLPNNIHELLEQNYCSDRLYSTQATCEANSKTWNMQTTWQTDVTSGLSYGWRGPYLSIANNPLDDSAINDGWGRFDSDKTNHNYGWRYFDLDMLTLNSADDGNLVIQSFGKNQQPDNSVPTTENYDNDYPPNYTSASGTFYPNPMIRQQDWLIDISNGISVNFIKHNRALPISLCTDTTKTTKATCLPQETWYGGCSISSYYNKTSCESATPTAGTWSRCSNATYTDKTACELAGKIWYGEGFGCSDQTKSNSVACISPSVWRSCTDDGTITTQNDCSTANQIWYGNDLFSISTIPTQLIPPTIPICMKVFYRKADSTIGILVSDEDVSTVHTDPKSILADGSSQTLKFKNFRDINTSNVTPNISIGSNAIGIYEYDGAGCNTSNVLYPINHRQPIQVDFYPHTGLSVINW